ncbi:PrsW family intramembrane metalloprotease [Kitasatospora sp. NPDC058965]|uniref:PrsW family intramembrane metalloprotease n=1 Tax=Kitasatospora sp. NPDC058965 TaxID=3346682 RepID=UPI0036A34FB1
MTSRVRGRVRGPLGARQAAGAVLPAGLLGCAALLVQLLHRQTGTEGLLVGLALAVLPVPFVLAALSWLNQGARLPGRTLALCLAWGSVAATTIALVANDWASDYLESVRGATAWGTDLATPLIEESAKGAVLLAAMLPLRRPPRHGTGPTPGARARLRHRAVARALVLGGMSACGFAFTENALYLGRAFSDDRQQRLESIGLGLAPSLRDYDDTVHTFLLRALLSPFAHPLFTALTGLGFAVALTGARRAARLAAPAGWLAAVALHGCWNAAAARGVHGFLLVYGLLMVPCFAALALLALWARARPRGAAADPPR